MAQTENTAAKQLEPFQFRPGQSGNPNGRPKGARNKLAEQFIQDVLVDWEAHGAQAIKDMREKNPGDYAKMVASLLPKDINLNLNNDIEMTDDELLDRIRALTEAVTPLLAGAGGVAEGEEAARGQKQLTRVH